MAAEATIHRPADEVFAYLADLSEWQANVLPARVTTPGPVRVGTEYTQTMRMGPATVDGRCRITGFEPGRALAFTLASKALDCAGELRLEPVPGGTRLTSTGTGRLHGPWRVLTPMVQAQVKRESQQEVDRIKAEVEAAAGSARGDSDQRRAGPSRVISPVRRRL